MSSRAAAVQQQAIELARRGDFGTAARDLNEELTRLEPANLGAWTRLARCCLELGQLEQATAALDSALQIDPANTIARSLCVEVERRRMPARAPATRSPRRTSTAQPADRSTQRPSAGAAAIDRSVFTTLGHLPSPEALEALTPRLEPLLMSLNTRPFAEKVVEARNRAGRSGNSLFRRNSLYAGEPGHIFAFHYGGRWEPQINLGFFAAPQCGRDSLRAGIGFNLTAHGTDPDPVEGQVRALDYFEQFQRLIGTSWRQLLSGWMSANGGFIQFGANRPATDMLPSDAISWLTSVQNPIETGWIFCGRWLFADRADHAQVLNDPRKVLSWLDSTFADLLPLWASVYRKDR
jgi:tetratricopeptide (TPR) repeat protein